MISLEARKRVDRAFMAISLAATLVGIFFLVVLLADVLRDGLAWLDWQFLTSFPSRFPEQAGIRSALVGSVYMILITAAIALPIGVATAVYLEEYAPENRLTFLIQTNIANLAGVPSIIYGLLGLEVFVRFLALDRSLISGALTMALLILPIIIIASQEAIRSVPREQREASYALGATKWQTIRHHVLPYSLVGILTGAILAVSRAIGEAAPLITIGALTFIAFLPRSIFDPFTVLPIQIFNWVSRPQAGFHHAAAAGMIVLLILLLTMNSAAIVIRNRYQRRLRW